MVEQITLQWEDDEERYRKLQLADLTAFSDRIDALTVSLLIIIELTSKLMNTDEE